MLVPADDDVEKLLKVTAAGHRHRGTPAQQKTP